MDEWVPKGSVANVPARGKQNNVRTVAGRGKCFEAFWSVDQIPFYIV